MNKNTKSDAIGYFIENGYPLVPLNGKTPLVKNWTKLEFNPNLTEADFPGNYGIVLQSDDLIIDYDPRNDITGNSLKRLIKDFNLPKTFIVKTGGGGVHLYFKKPKNIIIRCQDDNYPGIDFLSKGKQVVGPGSVHPKTKELYYVFK